MNFKNRFKKNSNLQSFTVNFIFKCGLYLYVFVELNKPTYHFKSRVYRVILYFNKKTKLERAVFYTYEYIE